MELQMYDKFEYRYINLCEDKRNVDIENYLNKYGEAGWEVINWHNNKVLLKRKLICLK